MTIAIYSNGLKDVYKGKREVKYGWMLDMGGLVKTGHSFDKEKAIKTARSTAGKHFTEFPYNEQRLRQGDERAKAEARAKEKGFKNLNEWKTAHKKEKADYLKKCKIEIVELN